MATLAIARSCVRPYHEHIRRRLEAAVEAAIAALDHLDGDIDLEDGFDQEAACEDDGYESDREPRFVRAWQLDQTNPLALQWGA